jgi:hypothetical protein
MGEHVKAASAKVVKDVQDTFDMFSRLTAITKDCTYQKTANAIQAFIKTRAAAAAEALMKQFPEAETEGRHVVGEAGHAIVLLVIADLTRQAEAERALGSSRQGLDAFIAAVQGAFAEPTGHNYGEIPVTLADRGAPPSAPAPAPAPETPAEPPVETKGEPAPEPPAGGTGGEHKEEKLS